MLKKIPQWLCSLLLPHLYFVFVVTVI